MFTIKPAHPKALPARHSASVLVHPNSARKMAGRSWNPTGKSMVKSMVKSSGWW